ncbi:hypothetical protein FB45DRAFT_916506 [Roridomyces roridus]|uniref:Lipid droplet-associated hydrolase n=1 Tax=Roridomyces roridus TaxID=1738132 RepID=A0AAD7BUA5_9AGAR|nr:hypothetical protein FB45DRAFT_916506 [Roridomyces roridus]
MLPPFLRPLNSAESYPPGQSLFDHPFGPVHSLWWDSCLETPDAVFLFIPGNPGLLNFYTEFLSSVHKSHPRMAVFGHAHLSHTPNLGAVKSSSLDAQVQSATEAVDAVRATFGQVKIVLCAHSVGAWIALQVLKCRPADIFHLFLLCPTITHIVDTPNGRKLSWFFASPIPWIVSWLSYMTRPLPLAFLFPKWSPPHRAVLRSLLNSPTSIFACLSMAHEEMQRIRDLDVTLMEESKMHFYFARKDDWVSRHRAAITHLFTGTNIVEGLEGVPHAFCIQYSEEVASQCSLWLNNIGL